MIRNSPEAYKAASATVLGVILAVGAGIGIAAGVVYGYQVAKAIGLIFKTVGAA
jgi:hypothetical protein